MISTIRSNKLSVKLTFIHVARDTKQKKEKKQNVFCCIQLIMLQPVLLSRWPFAIQRKHVANNDKLLSLLVMSSCKTLEGVPVIVQR